jgi:two-component system cell cycle sensor histidine kinase PleC
MDPRAFVFQSTCQDIPDISLLEAMPMAVYTTDAEGRITFYNQAATELWGRAPELGADGWCGAWRLYQPDGTPLPHDQCSMAVTLRENRPVRGCETVAERPDGTRVPFIPYPTPLKDAGGRLIGAINMLVDITERKRSELALQQRERELLEAQRIARMGHWRLDVAACRLEWSVGTHFLMGTSPETHAPSLPDLVSRIHPDDRQAYLRAFTDCFKSGKTSQWEFRTRNADGAEWVAWVEGRCEVDPDGRVVALFGICQDVTEQRRLQARLREARDAAETADRAKSSFLACMSHELRTPLNAIIGFSDLLRSEMFGPLGRPQYVEYADDIHRSGQHLLELVNDLLDMARIEAGMVDLADEPVDVSKLIAEAVHVASGAAPDVSHVFDIAVPEPPPILRADRRRIKQVLINLIGNAVKFTPDGGRIGVGVTVEDDGVSIAVTDTGIGIPRERIGDLGQPFSQIENVTSRRYQGSGMGLFITKALVERHGGAIEIDSRMGEGTTMTVTLPASRLIQAGPNIRQLNELNELVVGA